MTKLAQIQEAILQLEPKEQQELRHWLLEEESHEMLAAADQGLRSLVEEPTIPVTDIRQRIKGWTTK